MTNCEIQTTRLILLPAREDHVDDLHRLWTDPWVRKFLWDDLVIAQEQSAEVVHSSLESFARHGFGQWCVFLKEDSRLAGFCGLRLFGERNEVEILYALRPDLWGRGLAMEAASAVLRWGFNECDLDRIYAGADPPNVASFRVIERLGMKFAGRRVIDEVEAIYYSIDKEEFSNRPD
ncbi:MAG TPA: GNAT family N-acetyltransferase [Blastocatellia bacterium]|nr:GNAT family N-acetyltransferase [Blastocatellia bacterium]